MQPREQSLDGSAAADVVANHDRIDHRFTSSLRRQGQLKGGAPSIGE
jgi:hypothetical protein